MAVPIPSEERTFHPKRFRGAPRSLSTEPARGWLHHDATVRRNEQTVFEMSPTNMVTRGLSHVPPDTLAARTSLRMVPPPERPPHPEGRRNPHRVPPIPESRYGQFCPEGGMSVRPEVARAASSMATTSVKEHFIYGHVSTEAPAHPGKRIFPGSHERSTRGDMSLMKSGVKRVDITEACPSGHAIPGFSDIGRYSRPDDLSKMGKRTVKPEPWDPIRMFATYGRRHPAPAQACNV